MTNINRLTENVEATQGILDVQKEHHVPPDDSSNIVDFDGPDDSRDPLNWSNRYKWSMVILISLLSLIVYVSLPKGLSPKRMHIDSLPFSQQESCNPTMLPSDAQHSRRVPLNGPPPIHASGIDLGARRGSGAACSRAFVRIVWPTPSLPCLECALHHFQRDCSAEQEYGDADCDAVLAWHVGGFDGHQSLRRWGYVPGADPRERIEYYGSK